MPRLMLDLPDELRGPAAGHESVETQSENGRTGTRESTGTANGRGRERPAKRVVRWHQCWAGSDGQ